jgi:FecR protein
VASNSSVQMKSFATTDMAHAQFVVAGKVRFKVNHPQGARADYQFQTTTGQIAVRGTEGDIFSSPQGLQVNVYAVSNPALPVQVTLVNGQVFTLAAGQSLVATAAAGAVTASVTGVTQSLFSPFTELGAPINASSFGIASGAAAGSAATDAALTSAAAAAGAAAAITTISNSNSKSPSSAPAAATPSPAPAPTGTSVPITVNGGHRDGSGPPHPGPHPPLP